MSWRPPPCPPPPASSSPCAPQSTGTSDNACNNAVVQLPAFCQHTDLRVYAYATNSDDPNPLASAVDVQLSSTPVEDGSWNRYVVLNGLSFAEIGRWRVSLYGLVHGQEVWRILAGYVQVEIAFVDVGGGPYLSYSETQMLRDIGMWWVS